jgi:hypothetical protein
MGVWVWVGEVVRGKGPIEGLLQHAYRFCDLVLSHSQHPQSS